MSLSAVTIMGVSGGFGRAFARRFAADGIRVTGVDISTVPLPGDWLESYVRADAADCDWAGLGATEPGRLILLCLPQHAVIAAMPRLLTALAPQTTAADIVSVKSPLAAEFVRHNTTGQYVSLHPMFGPTATWDGQQWASVVLRDGAGVLAIERWIARDATVSRMTADEHDRATAVTQAAVHAAVLAFGAVVAGSSVSREHLAAVGTPPTRVLTALLARIATADPELFRHIQHDNPHAASARATLSEALGRLGDQAAFSSTMASVVPRDARHLTDLAAKLVEVVREPHPT